MNEDNFIIDILSLKTYTKKRLIQTHTHIYTYTLGYHTYTTQNTHTYIHTHTYTLVPSNTHNTNTSSNTNTHTHTHTFQPVLLGLDAMMELYRCESIELSIPGNLPSPTLPSPLLSSPLLSSPLLFFFFDFSSFPLLYPLLSSSPSFPHVLPLFFFASSPPFPSPPLLFFSFLFFLLLSLLPLMQPCSVLFYHSHSLPITTSTPTLTTWQCCK